MRQVWRKERERAKEGRKGEPYARGTKIYLTEKQRPRLVHLRSREGRRERKEEGKGRESKRGKSKRQMERGC